jgi:UDP-N-acetylglucosamine 2-epimerase (non-hydrolysing)
MRKIIIVIGTRPNFIKITRFKELVSSYPDLSIELIHTNQHYDDAMSGVFFKQFGIEVDHFLERYEGSANAHFGHIIQGLDAQFQLKSPDLVMVVGDVNSTLAAALVANRLGIKIAHLESGLRSDDLSMPEEINRILTDKITDYFFVTEPSGRDNLLHEGVDPSKIYYVGNTMIDTLVHFDAQIHQSNVCQELGIGDREYSLITLHRPSNVDSEEDIRKILSLLMALSNEIRIVFPMHHRTRASIQKHGLTEAFDQLENCVICDSLDYFSFQKLISDSLIVITDSGGVQEETTYLGIPCITLRENTERPITITEGTNEMMSFDSEKLIDIISNRTFKRGVRPQLWDGKATERILEHIDQFLTGHE